MRRRLVVAAVLIAAIAIVFAVRARRRSNPGPTVATAALTQRATPSNGPTQAQLQSDILRNGLTAEKAALFFSMVVGPLPGVSVPDGSRDPSEFDGTLAVEYLYREWNALTDAQRRAARQLIEGPAAASGRASRLPDPPEPAVVLAAYAPPPTETPAYDFSKLAGDADATLALFLNVAPIPKYLVTVRYDTPPGSEKAHTVSWYKPEDRTSDWRTWLDGCHIIVWNQQFETLTQTDAESIMTHEMFHCYQQRQAATEEAALSVPAWVREGEATWVMSVVVPAATGILVNKWTPYIQNPKTVYSLRAHDAIGVFAHLSDLAGNEAVWQRLLPVVTAGIGDKQADAFNLLIKGNETAYYTSWGASYFQEGLNHKLWNMNGPGTPPMASPPATPVSVNAGIETELDSLDSDQAGVFSVSGGADVVTVALLTGYGRLHDQSYVVDTALDASGPLALCLKDGGCTCPDGTPGASLITQRATGPLSIGVEGGDMKSEVAVSGRSLDDFCKDKKPDKKEPAPPNGGGGGGGGGADNPQKPDNPPPDDGASVGDPHLTTFDGLRYDFQVVGEYTLARSTKDDFIVQIRQVPVLGSRMASLNQAVATRLGGDRVTIALENGAEVLRINGKVTSGPLPTLKGGSLTSAQTMYGVAYQLTWPDGSVLRAEQLGRYAINVKLHPAASRREALTGLLGLHAVPGSITHALADAWRVTDATSLFDYLPGQSASTFVDPTFPNADINSAAIPNRATAEQACRNAGLTDPHLLDNCILDLAVTNESLFGSAYGHAQRVLAARTVHRLVSTPASAEQLPVLIMSGAITNKIQKPEFQFDARAGDVIWINPPDCSDSGAERAIWVQLLDPTGKGIRGAAGCQVGRYAVPVTGRYTLRANPGKTDVGAYHIPIRFVRHDRVKAISYGDEISGTIETVAAHDVYTFSGKAGDVVQLSGDGCDLHEMFTGIVDTQNFDLLGPGCRSGTGAKLTQAGTYTLIINYTNTGTGPYHFVLQNVGSGGR